MGQGYKGEDNLRRLDVPAYERRSQAHDSDASQEGDTQQSAGDGTNGQSHSEGSAAAQGHDQKQQGRDNARNESPKIRRLHADDYQDREERIRKDDPDTPAFLRKMMD